MLNTITYIYIFLMEMITVYVYSYRLFGIRHKIWISVTISVLGYTLFYLINMATDNNLVFNIVSYAIITYIMIRQCFNASVRSAVFHTIMLWALLGATEFISISLITGVFHLDIASYQDNGFLYAVEAVLAKSLFFIASLIISNFASRERKNIDHGRSWYLILSPLTTVFVLIIFAIIANQHIITGSMAYMCLAASVLMFASDLLVLWVYENVQEKSEQIIQNNMEKQRIDLNNNYYEILDKQNENMHILIHDMRNHLGIISGIAENDEVTDYIGEICDDMNKYLIVKQSGNKMLDIILGKYTVMCESNNIKFSTNTITSNIDFIQETDLSAMVSNMLDNAFEAAKGSENAFIEFASYTLDKKSSVISVLNSSSRAPKSEKQSLLTIKDNKDSHGFGTKSIKKAAGKYSGSYSWFYDEEKKVFHSMVMMPLNEKQLKANCKKA